MQKKQKGGGSVVEEKYEGLGGILHKLKLTCDLGRLGCCFAWLFFSCEFVYYYCFQILALSMRISIPRRGDGTNVCYVALQQ